MRDAELFGLLGTGGFVGFGILEIVHWIWMCWAELYSGLEHELRCWIPVVELAF